MDSTLEAPTKDLMELIFSDIMFQQAMQASLHWSPRACNHWRQSSKDLWGTSSSSMFQHWFANAFIPFIIARRPGPSWSWSSAISCSIKLCRQVSIGSPRHLMLVEDLHKRPYGVCPQQQHVLAISHTCIYCFIDSEALTKGLMELIFSDIMFQQAMLAGLHWFTHACIGSRFGDIHQSFHWSSATSSFSKPCRQVWTRSLMHSMPCSLQAWAPVPLLRWLVHLSCWGTAAGCICVFTKALMKLILSNSLSQQAMQFLVLTSRGSFWAPSSKLNHRKVMLYWERTKNCPEWYKCCATPDRITCHNLKNLLQLIAFWILLQEFDIDTERLPLGTLSKAQVQRGYDVLERIRAALNGSAESLERLSSEFYQVQFCHVCIAIIRREE